MLVIGGAGFVGAHLLPRLVESGAGVSATCRPGTQPPVTPGVAWLPSDLAAPDVSRAWPSPCETVIYLAQSKAWRRFPEGAADGFDVNVAGLFRAAEFARLAGARRVIYLSSGSVYPTLQAEASESVEFPVPSDRRFYPAAKLAGEILLGPYASLFPVITLRLFMPYGAGQDPKMLMPQLVGRVQAGEAITLDGEDGLRANPVAVADVIETLVRCVSLDRTVTMNVAGPQILTLRDIATTIGHHVGRTPVLERRPGTVAGSVIGDTSRLESALGWKPTRVLSEGLGDWLG